ncbi:hypothetical protein EFJ49_21630 [Escherichia coli]|uniref:hypothetical protein n=1 Tax=Escherichia coli TaxID=562 RepID=UPI001F4996AA|nr:hypothetical protein [Escherichia coli]MCH7127894.1 hypothetical protein [Escherichia coli]
MRMTNEQLIDAAHKAAKYLPPASAQLMSDLATQLDVALVAVRTACAERHELEERCEVLRAKFRAYIDETHQVAAERDCPFGVRALDWLRKEIKIMHELERELAQRDKIS